MHERAAELLVGCGQQVAAVAPGEAAVVAAGPVGQPRAVAGSAGQRCDGDASAGTPHRRVRPRGDQVLARGGVMEKPASSSKTSRAPRAAASLPRGARSPSPSRPQHRRRVPEPGERRPGRTSRCGPALAHAAEEGGRHPSVPTTPRVPPAERALTPSSHCAPAQYPHRDPPLGTGLSRPPTLLKARQHLTTITLFLIDHINM